MADGLGIRCVKRGIGPVLGMWDYYRTEGNGVAMSVAVFQWIGTDDGTSLIRDNVAKRYPGTLDDFDSLCHKAETLCQKLENQTEVARCDDPRIRMNAAAAANAPTETLASLSTDEDPRIRLRVARHRNTDSWTLEKLSKDLIAEVRAAVAWNPNTNALIRTALAEDGVGTVNTAARQATSFANQP